MEVRMTSFIIDFISVPTGAIVAGLFIALVCFGIFVLIDKIISK